MRDVTVKLPEPLIAAVLGLARQRDATFGQIVRQAVSAEIGRASRNAKTPNRADEQLVAPLRALLAADFARSRSWQELNDRLRAKGYALREAGGGLALHSHPGGTRMCKASELGHAYSALMRRFGAPFANHRHRHLADRILGPARTSDRFDVIEPF